MWAGRSAINGHAGVVRSLRSPMRRRWYHEGDAAHVRAHQNLIWDRTRATNRLRNSLREYFPAALATFGDLADRDTLAVLAKAPTPGEAKALPLGKIRSALKAGGRQRNIDDRARTIAAGLRTDALGAPRAVVSAFAATTRSSVAIIAALNLTTTAPGVSDPPELARADRSHRRSQASACTPGGPASSGEKRVTRRAPR